MLSGLIKKEILEHLMSLRFAIACVLCLIVVLCSLLVRCQDYGQVLDDYQQESKIEKNRLDRLRWPWGLAWEGLTVHRRPNPLKIFVRGVSDTNGGATRVSAYRRLEPIVAGMENPSVPLFQAIDLVAFVGLILSLMAVVFGYDAICGEKERGTLRLMLSYSVPRHLILLSKWIGGYVTLILPFLLTMVVGAVIVLIQPDFNLTEAQWGRLLIILGLALIYVAAIYSLALYVSCLTRRAATSVMLLLSGWVILVLAIPNLSPHVARIFRPAAGVKEVEEARTASEEDMEKWAEEKIKAYWLQQGVDPRKLDWRNPEQQRKILEYWYYEWGVRKQASLGALEADIKIEQRYAPRLNAQIELSRWIGRVSPFSCFALAATELADAGTIEQDRYHRQLRKYQITFAAYAHDEGLAMTKIEMENDGELPEPYYKLRTNPVPKFSYAPPAPRDYLGAVAADGGILVGMAVAFFMLSYLTFLRYDVR